MCIVAKMSYIFVFLLGVVACVKAAMICPIPDYPVCGNDGRTYKNICEWQLAILLKPSLELLHLGSCTKSAYGLYSALMRDNRQSLRSRKHKKNHKNKRLSDSEGPDDFGDDFIQRLANLPFNFRREQEVDEEQQED